MEALTSRRTYIDEMTEVFLHAVIRCNIFLYDPGTVTTSTTMHCMIAVLVNKPDLQKRITDEIHETIGDRPPRLSDRTSLPYTEAVIMETFRYTTIVPLSTPHKATIDTQLGGFDIPRGTMVSIRLSSNQ